MMSFGTVFDFPRVVKCVPGDAARGVAGGPPALAKGAADVRLEAVVRLGIGVLDAGDIREVDGRVAHAAFLVGARGDV